ncbi:MAG TPA: PadR family transcriptional regulator [Streptosporangiaceae bacterium]|jgi:DNA-binding PadR family transcriptional regulator
MAASPRRSPLALAVLATLLEAPMHPYRMQQLIKERGKEEVINVRQRASIYQTIDRLLRDGLVAVRETERDENWPERTVYELTPAGRQLITGWVREMLSAPARDYPEFPAALAYMMLLEPADAAAQLRARADTLAAELDRVGAGLAAARYLPRIVLIEDEYRIALLRAELSWLTAVIAELREGTLSWDEAQLREVAARYSPATGS